MELAAYAKQILALLPKGAAWSGEKLRGLVSSFAGEPHRVATAAEDLAIDANPATTSDLLSDYERLVGLPYPGFELAGTTADRRSDVLSVLLAQGGQSKEYFLSLIEARGHIGATIVDRYPMFVAGSSAGDLLYGLDWIYYWEVRFASSSDSDPLLEFLLTRYAPAHTKVGFVYL